jgi:hypothetical protein
MVRKQKEVYALVGVGKHYEIPLAVRQSHSWQVHTFMHRRRILQYVTYSFRFISNKSWDGGEGRGSFT